MKLKVSAFVWNNLPESVRDRHHCQFSAVG